MANFPTSLPSFTNPSSGNYLNSPAHATQHSSNNDETIAIATKVGITNSVDTNSLDYKLSNLGIWTTYVPTFTNVTVGNATLDASYAQIGKTVFVRVAFTMGSTSSVSGLITFSVPATGMGGFYGVGTVYIEDQSTQSYMGFVRFSSLNATTVILLNNNGSDTGTTSPMTWTTGDYFRTIFTYEAT